MKHESHFSPDAELSASVENRERHKTSVTFSITPEDRAELPNPGLYESIPGWTSFNEPDGEVTVEIPPDLFKTDHTYYVFAGTADGRDLGVRAARALEREHEKIPEAWRNKVKLVFMKTAAWGDDGANEVLSLQYSPGTAVDTPGRWWLGWNMLGDLGAPGLPSLNEYKRSRQLA